MAKKVSKSDVKKRVVSARRKVKTPEAKEDTRRKRAMPSPEELAEAALAAYVAYHAKAEYPPV